VPSAARAAMIEISRSKGTKASRISGTPPSASQAPAKRPLAGERNTRWPLPS
jgi:hypothetical protein